jgi:indolepyruvate ferredoxin oxidoreductase beta subunit
MTRHESFPTRLAGDRPFSVAILAMGGQGGAVLADWIVALAEAEGWFAQSTSVPGVAQRTGATIYYLEMLKAKEGRTPVLSLMPTPGDVDVVIAAEYMEAGRSMLRGLVTPDRTTLIASTHRAFAVSEKEPPGDGIGDPLAVSEATGIAAKRTVAFDMQAIADENSSVISASLFGALAGSGAMPFPRAAFEAAIRATGTGVEPSLKAFSAAYDHVGKPAPVSLSKAPTKRFTPIAEALDEPALAALPGHIRGEFPETLRPMLMTGLRRVVDFQDLDYGAEYLDRIAGLLAGDRAANGEAKGYAFTEASAKYVAVAMAYDDVIRVADLKTRASRFGRLKAEVGVRPDQVLHVTEFMHPRMEEVAGTLPKRLGLWIEARPRLFRALDRVVNRGRRVRTDAARWFFVLYALAGMRRFRRGTLRHAREIAHLERWLALAVATLPKNYDLAVEIVACRRLVKGYSDTHARGETKFDRVLSALPLLEMREDGGAWLRRLRQAALLDEEGKALEGALKTVATLQD